MGARPLAGSGGEAEAVVRKSKAAVWTLEDPIQIRCMLNST